MLLTWIKRGSYKKPVEPFTLNTGIYLKGERYGETVGGD